MGGMKRQPSIVASMLCRELSTELSHLISFQIRFWTYKSFGFGPQNEKAERGDLEWNAERFFSFLLLLFHISFHPPLLGFAV